MTAPSGPNIKCTQILFQKDEFWIGDFEASILNCDSCIMHVNMLNKAANPLKYWINEWIVFFYEKKWKHNKNIHYISKQRQRTLFFQMYRWRGYFLGIDSALIGRGREKSEVSHIESSIFHEMDVNIMYLVWCNTRTGNRITAKTHYVFIYTFITDTDSPKNFLYKW